MTLNLGCGTEKIKDCINVDLSVKLKPDLVANFLYPLPFRDRSLDRVLLFHVIEHIPERHHVGLLMEIRRVLKVDGIFLCSYPEFLKCAQNWIDNKFGRRQFWKWTIYGRQNWDGDAHVSLMYTPSFVDTLKSVGFHQVKHTPEPTDDFNTVVCAVNSGRLPKTIEDIYVKEWFTATA